MIFCEILRINKANFINQVLFGDFKNLGFHENPPLNLPDKQTVIYGITFVEVIDNRAYQVLKLDSKEGESKRTILSSWVFFLLFAQAAQGTFQYI